MIRKHHESGTTTFQTQSLGNIGEDPSKIGCNSVEFWEHSILNNTPP
jgi:hypothetical protein